MNNNSPVYDVDYFIDKFSKIESDRFLIREYGNSRRGCAMGLCSNNLSEHLALSILGNKFIPTNYSSSFIPINNGDHPYYKERTAKERVLSALYDIKKLQEQQSSKDTMVGQKSEEQVGKVEYTDLTKSLATLPVEETSDVLTSKIVSVC